jgi:hypothetical protein
MNINYMLTISEYKHKTTWCLLGVLLKLLTVSVARPQTKNEAVSQAVAMCDYFLDKGRGIASFIFNHIKTLTPYHFSAFAYTEIYHISRNYDDHSWCNFRDD